jgi:hypothetical protein
LVAFSTKRDRIERGSGLKRVADGHRWFDNCVKIVFGGDGLLRMTEGERAPATPTRFPVTVLMERRNVDGNPWISERWKAVGVTVGAARANGGVNPVRVVSGPDGDQYLWSGLQVELFRDEAESYYHNLMASTPGCYIIARFGEDGMPAPVLVTLSFDAGQAYLEGGDTVYNVPLPP